MNSGNAQDDGVACRDGAAGAEAEEALEWFVRLRDGTADATTRTAFEAWLDRDARNRQAFRDLESVWGSASFGRAVADLPAAGPAVAWPGAGRARRRMVVAVAAVMLLALGIGTYLPQALLHWRSDYLTATGDRRTVSLPDGSTMMLNTASAAAIDFEDGRRQVRLLAGEAFFDVRQDAGRPFFVVGEHGRVEVLGTAFSVRVDGAEDRVVLERGAVDLSRLRDLADHVHLAPGEMAEATAGATSRAMAVDAERLLAWREGRVVFSGASFSEVLAELRRYYPGTIILAARGHADLAMTGNYRIDDIEGAVRTLADAAGLATTRLPGGFIILR